MISYQLHTLVKSGTGAKTAQCMASDYVRCSPLPRRTCRGSFYSGLLCFSGVANFGFPLPAGTFPTINSDLHRLTVLCTQNTFYFLLNFVSIRARQINARSAASCHAPPQRAELGLRHHLRHHRTHIIHHPAGPAASRPVCA